MSRTTRTWADWRSRPRPPIPWAGAVYFTVDRYVARPQVLSDLRRYDVVISDRSFYSTLAYQGCHLTPTERRRLQEWTDRVAHRPDLVLWIRLSPEEAIERISTRARRRDPLETERRLRQVDGAYRRLALRYRFVRIDGSRTPAEIARDAVRAVTRRLSRPRGRT
ncbi:dTMP kinase [mine drainage metagenome]|uniref:dTMP kinase n=1 Tax=mine drainage metagenome TaxID=410659 RepID=T0Z5F8_9ZZZZ